MILTARKKPVEVKAILWTGKNLKEVLNFIGYKEILVDTNSEEWKTTEKFVLENGVSIPANKGLDFAMVSDFIINSDGDLSICKPDIFYKTYDLI